jgi:hypothetical protein
LFPSVGKLKNPDGKPLKNGGKSSKSDGKMLEHDG